MNERHGQAIKLCSKCGKPYPLTGYYRDRTSKDGRRPDCKGCYEAMVNRMKLQKWEGNARAITETRDRKRQEMEAKLASMGLLQG